MRRCKHFGECGGCSFQDLPYAKQLEEKEKRLKSRVSLEKVDTQLRPINYYRQWYYRNRMEFTFDREGGVICGLHHRQIKGKVVDLEECLIFSPDLKKILRGVKEFVNEKGYSVYDRFSHKGFLRHFIVREAKFTRELMLGVVTTSAGELDRAGLVESLLKERLASQVRSIYWIVNDSLSDAVIFQKKLLLYGEPFIQENLANLKFKIMLDSFFQVNPRGIKDLYCKTRGYSQVNKGARVLDLFCGAGGVGLFLAAEAKFVWGVEIKEEAVEAAFVNAKINGIENISFISADVRRFLSSQGAFYRESDILTVNPPRCGLSKKIIRGILRLNPKQIFYSSCNADTLCRDIKEISARYKVDFIEPFDFFPHTPHFECLAALSCP